MAAAASRVAKLPPGVGCALTGLHRASDRRLDRTRLRRESEVPQHQGVGQDRGRRVGRPGSGDAEGTAVSGLEHRAPGRGVDARAKSSSGSASPVLRYRSAPTLGGWNSRPSPSRLMTSIAPGITSRPIPSPSNDDDPGWHVIKLTPVAGPASSVSGRTELADRPQGAERAVEMTERPAAPRWEHGIVRGPDRAGALTRPRRCGPQEPSGTG
jgi:hypothetical protein